MPSSQLNYRNPGACAALGVLCVAAGMWLLRERWSFPREGEVPPEPIFPVRESGQADPLAGKLPRRRSESIARVWLEADPAPARQRLLQSTLPPEAKERLLAAASATAPGP